MKQMNRTLKPDDARCNLKRLRFRRGMDQIVLLDGVNAVLSRQNNGEWYPPLDRVALSKAENGYVLLIPEHVHAIAAFLGCSAHDIYPNLYTEDASG